jgi:hypothetical protein
MRRRSISSAQNAAQRPPSHSGTSRASGDNVNINVLLTQIKLSLMLNSGTRDSRAATVLWGLNFHTLRYFHSNDQEINRSGDKLFGSTQEAV